jgi:hypothetical protein
VLGVLLTLPPELDVEVDVTLELDGETVVGLGTVELSWLDCLADGTNGWLKGFLADWSLRRLL